ncbi:MAG TPA: hypothetical protein VGQ83_07005 [Polyangia bacterium]|jgi:hypothetical protein
MRPQHRSSATPLLVALAFTLAAPAAFGQPATTLRDAVEPYGFVLLNGAYNSHAVNNIDVPYIVTTTAKQGSLTATARQTRLGLNLRYPSEGIRLLGGAKLSGKVEADFFGGMPNAGYGDAFGLARLRLAYMTLDWGPVQLVAGQDWIILAPLNPITIAHVSVVGFAGAGNLWFRLPQLRLQGQVGKRFGFEWAAGVLAPYDQEPTDPASKQFQTANTPGPGERSKTPMVQGRVAGYATFLKKRATLGVSAHYSRERYDLSAAGSSDVIERRDITCWAVAADLMLPIGQWAALSGELFTGSDIDIFWGGALQGVRKQVDPADPDKKRLTDVTRVRSTGGWGQLSLYPVAPLGVHLGLGLDQPKAADVQPLSGSTPAIAANSAFYAAAIYSPLPRLRFALEVDRMWTRYIGTDAAEFTVPATHVNLAAFYEF